MCKKEIKAIEDSLREWFPDKVFIKAAYIKSYSISEIEEAIVTNAVSSRKNEFSTGRWLARQGLQKFSLPVVPIKIGKLRNPLWPESVIGSISHDVDYCAVVLMQKQFHSEQGIGIDLLSLLQRDDKLKGLESMIMSHVNELDAVKQLNLKVDPILLLFSIKESVIKSLSFYLNDYIDMRSIEITYSNKLFFKVTGCSVKADVFATKVESYLLTAVKVYQIEV